MCKPNRSSPLLLQHSLYPIPYVNILYFRHIITFQLAKLNIFSNTHTKKLSKHKRSQYRQAKMLRVVSLLCFRATRLDEIIYEIEVLVRHIHLVLIE